MTALGGAAIAWPLRVRAQQKVMPVIGYLSPGSSDRGLNPALPAFFQGLREAGYVESQNVMIEFRAADGDADRLPRLADDLVSRKVDVMVAAGGIASSLAAKGATSTIPIVFTVGIDPVAAGLVDSLARPGGNLTGVSALLVDLTPKRLELISELVPQATVFAFLVNPNSPQAERVMNDATEAARAKRLQLAVVKATSDMIDGALASLGQLHADALVIADDVFFFQRREQLVASAARYAVPAIYFLREFAASGGLISYGPNLAAIYRQLGIYAGRILSGQKPADLPVQQPDKFELVINLKTSKALGLTVPQSLLARADEVIE